MIEAVTRKPTILGLNTNRTAMALTVTQAAAPAQNSDFSAGGIVRQQQLRCYWRLQRHARAELY